MKSQVKDKDARVDWSNGVLLAESLTTQQAQPFKRSKTIAEIKKEAVIERKQTLKRKLTIKVKQDPEKIEESKVGWSKPTAGIEAIAIA